MHRLFIRRVFPVYRPGLNDPFVGSFSLYILFLSSFYFLSSDHQLRWRSDHRMPCTAVPYPPLFFAWPSLLAKEELKKGREETSFTSSNDDSPVPRDERATPDGARKNNLNTLRNHLWTMEGYPMDRMNRFKPAYLMWTPQDRLKPATPVESTACRFYRH